MWIVGQIDASIVAALILVAVHFGRHLLPPAIRSALLAIALVRLALPPLIRSPWSEALVDAAPIDDARSTMALWLHDDAWQTIAALTTMVSILLLIRLGRSIAVSRSLAVAGTRPGPDGLQTKVEVRIAPDDRGPLAAGFRDRVIVLPASILETASRQQLAAVLAHETGHHERRDLVWMALARAAAAIVWFNPLTHLISRALLAAREDGCDDWAMARTGRDPFAYAQALLQSARLMAARDNGMLIARAHPMGVRVRRLLAASAVRDERRTAPLFVVILIAAAAFIPAAHTPNVSDDLNPPTRVVIVVRR